jgi:hypothetical protein
VALVRTFVSENISPPPSGFLSVVGFHRCVAVASQLISLSIEGHYVVAKNTAFWEVFMAVSMTDVFWNSVPMTLVKTDVSENTSPPCKI